MTASRRCIVLLCAASTAVASCRGNGSQEPAPDQRVGNFDFTVRYRTSTLSGTLRVAELAMTVDAADGLCVPSHQPSFSDEYLLFECTGLVDVDKLVLSISRQYPKGRSRWFGSVTRQVSRRECSAYSRDDKGNVICISYQTVTVDVTDRVGGELLLQWKAPLAGASPSVRTGEA